MRKNKKLKKKLITKLRNNFTIRKYFSYLYKTIEKTLVVIFDRKKYSYSITTDKDTAYIDIRQIISIGSIRLVSKVKGGCSKYVSTVYDGYKHAMNIITFLIIFHDPTVDKLRVLYMKFPEALRDGDNKDSKYLVFKFKSLGATETEDEEG